MANVFGTPLKRREDPRLITGNGNYTDDIQLPGMLFAAVLRSPHAHARIKRIDVSAAREAEGVAAVYTGQDLAGKMEPIPTAWLPPDSDMKTPAHPALAVDTVRYVGDGVALVVADDRYSARDALDLIEVEYEELPVSVSQEEAMKDGAAQLHEDVPNNLAFHWKAGEVPDEVFDQAEVSIRQRFNQQRLIPNPMEMRAAVARYNPGSQEMTIWCTSQNPHIHRFILSGVLGIPES
ncbi:MAG TPA: molybdopterin cofactor-binding domain-containing protein, partial [Bacillales bacterium]|nr:molybdopterin cofactor-binding domain-containing protein [Bacillales bacterium]